MRLQGKVAVITGAARGIGAATAAAFLREGARVCVCDVAPADSAVESQEHAGASMYQQCSVIDREQVHDAFEAVVDRWGKLDILVNNAGITRDKSLLKMTDEQFDSVIDVNLKGTFVCTQEAARLMAQQGGGVILNAASIVALDGNFGITNYAASKAGIVGMTKVWARELGSKNIRVNAVCPGFIETEMTRAMPASVLESMRASIPLGRLGKPEDVAALYAFLASDEASFIHGATFRVDGGQVIGTGVR